MKKGLGVKKRYYCKVHKKFHDVHYHHSLKFKRCTAKRIERGMRLD